MTRTRCPSGATPHAVTRLALVLALLAIPRVALSQLQPERLYYGRDRAAPMVVEVPEGFAGEARIALFEPGGESPIDSAPAAAGRVDVAALFPTLWTADDPRLVYAQLELDGVPVGAPVVLQPLLTPNTAANVSPQNPLQPTFGRGTPLFEDDRLALMARSGLAESPERSVTFSGMRAYVDKQVVFDTSAGEIVFRMRPDVAPDTVFNFLHLVEGGFYTDVIFHRVVAQLPGGAPFVIQCGDPTGTGSGGPGYFIDLEKSTLPHDFGVLSMARSNDPNTNGSQVFVCLSREGTARLDGLYTSFAETVAGADVILKIASVETGDADRPIEPPVIRSARLVDAPPFGSRPSPVTRPEPEPVDR
ncbi:MAG: peptidylprolyl isomerase [Phycisphaerales bacterium]